VICGCTVVFRIFANARGRAINDTGTESDGGRDLQRRINSDRGTPENDNEKERRLPHEATRRWGSLVDELCHARAIENTRGMK
jgi:hypothetical protein